MKETINDRVRIVRRNGSEVAIYNAWNENIGTKISKYNIGAFVICSRYSNILKAEISYALQGGEDYVIKVLEHSGGETSKELIGQEVCVNISTLSIWKDDSIVAGDVVRYHGATGIVKEACATKCRVVMDIDREDLIKDYATSEAYHSNRKMEEKDERT